MTGWTRRGLVATGAAAMAAPVWAGSTGPALWEVRRGDARVLLFGDGGPLRTPWSSAPIEAAVRACGVFWKETPDAGPEAFRLFVAKGVDPASPLASWLTPTEHTRAIAAAAIVGLASATLERFRPWLAGVVLDSSFRSHFGFKADNAPEHVLDVIARAAEIPIRTEFPDEAAIVDYFANLSNVAQVGELMRAVEDVEAGPDVAERRAEAWAVGDQRLSTRFVLGVRRAYPEYYEQLLAARNRRWAVRFRAMLDGGGTSFVVVGDDHLAGPDSVLAELARAGMHARRM
jgi:hypothetical protein